VNGLDGDVDVVGVGFSEVAEVIAAEEVDDVDVEVIELRLGSLESSFIQK